MNKITNKTKVIVIITIIVLLLLSIFLVTRLQKEKESEITSSKSNITLIYTDFEEKTEINEKFEILNNLISSFEEYKNEDDTYSEVTTEYEDKIKLMKEYFVSYYDETLNKNTLKEIENISDTDKINKSKENLNKLIELINTQKDVTLDEKSYLKYEETIKSTIKSYDDRLDSLKQKAEEEAAAKKKAEEEAKKQEQSNSNKNNSSSSNSSNAASKPNNKPSKPSGSNWKDSMSYMYSIDENGNKKEIWYNPSTGEAYDTNRNYVGNVYDWVLP
ncbi:MAG: hypothetical protein E6860_11320 [Clostridium sp.]|uniref:hypothetical protein n=1 Tax=Clostridium TaxID=1485 RepID=UPI0012B7146F|nr:MULTISPECIES: hypothetical protein [Clostridium]MBS6888110.1 hypothetical protein [Clostridium sp.]MDU1586116.1 hypothetical protein [Clostridium sp.]